MEMLLERKVLHSNNFFLANLLNFLKIQTIIKSCKISFFNAKGLKLGHFYIFEL